MEKVLEVSGIEKSFKNGRGIRDIHLSISKGEVFGLIGPNGAGKTTLMKSITGLLTPNAGKVSILGRDLEKEYKQAIRNVGAYIGSGAIYPHLTANQNLKMILRLYPEVPVLRIDEVLELVGLTSYKHERASAFSMGMTQRLGLAAAVLSNPKLVILDEPANDLDIDGMLIFRNTVQQLADSGIAFLISSHLTSELEKICSHFGILINGEMKGIVPKDAIPSGSSIEDIYIEKIGGVQGAGIR